MFSDNDKSNFKSNDGSGSSGKDLIKVHSQKYDDVLKAKKEELRRKRGALELNSDLENIDADHNVVEITGAAA